MTALQQKIDENSASVQSHLTIQQSVIQRMASNSAGAKTWCITVVSAILVVVADKNKPDYVLLALIPCALFFFLDAYYLSLEKRFRASYNSFIKKLHEGSIEARDLFCVVPGEGAAKQLGLALLSLSVWPFYGVLVGMVWLAKVLLLTP